MMLIRLIYSSRALEQLRDTDVDQILRVSMERNAKAGVTGLLVYSAREFLQCLEGGRDVVNATYQRILRDPRHAEVTILDYAEVAQRWFPDWSMRQLPPLALNRRRLLRYFPRELFTPGRLSAAGASALVHELAEEQVDTAPSSGTLQRR